MQLLHNVLELKSEKLGQSTFSRGAFFKRTTAKSYSSKSINSVGKDKRKWRNRDKEN